MSVHHSQRGDGYSVSRATSVSRKSTQSRNQTLIQKQIAPHDLRPSDILIERFLAWKSITKQLISYFEGVADIENNTAKELTKLGGVIQVPFRAGNQFLGEGGLQDIYYSVRDKTRIIADHHANLAKTIEGSIVQHLQKLRFEIKAHIKNVQNDTGKLATVVAKERELSTKHIADLSRTIAVYKNTPMSINPKDDPYCQNQVVMRQLQKQVNEENSLQKSIIIMQQNSAHFEEGIVRSVQSAWQTYEEWRSRMSSSVQDTWAIMAQNMAGLTPDREWISFAMRSDHLLDPDTPLRNPETIEYPSKDDPSVIPVHVGMLERKKRFTRTYREAYYVLTPAGYLHEFAGSDPRQHIVPTFSLFLPACTLGPPSSASASKSHKFHIESKKDGEGITRTGGLLSRSTHAYTFRARSHDEMMEWWNDVRMLVARYLIASEQMERSGPVAAAVRAAGYVSEEEEEESEDGSSVEEEEDEDGVEYVAAHEDQEEEAVPAYSHPTKESGIQLGTNGYALEKKRSRDDHHHGTGASTGGADVSRRLSRRQEKAPEGQPPHASGQRDLPHGAAAEPGPAPADTDSESEDIPNHKASTAVPIIPPPVTVGPEVIAPLPVTTSSGAAESSGAGAGAVAHANEDDDDDEHHAEGDHPREKRSSKLISKFKEMITK